jgi:DNA-binding transcriptional MerR regulator
VARTFDVHPNTIRLYEAWGYLPPIPRGPQGYRLFGEAHLRQMRLARLALRAPASGPQIRDSIREIVWLASSGDLAAALAQARKHRKLILATRAQALTAIAFLRGGPQPGVSQSPMRVQETARHLGISVPLLRRWERYGLICVPRDPHNRYRAYGPQQLGRLYLIRMLRQAGYTIEASLRLLPRSDNKPRSGRHAARTGDGALTRASEKWLATLAALERHAAAILHQLESIIEAPPPGPA